MARRSETFLNSLMGLPWWVGISGACFIYFISHFVFSAISFENIVINSFAKTAPFLGKLFALLFLIGGILSAFQTWFKRRRLESQTGIETIRLLDWKAFEELVAEAFRRKGYRVQDNSMQGPDGGVDLRLRKEDELVLVQCKQWRTNRVGVKIVRELYGVMAGEGAAKGIVVTSGSFTSEAKAFANEKPLELLEGPELFFLIQEVQKNMKSGSVLKQEKEGPSCPKCGEKMVVRTARQGASAGHQFWGCSSFPNCKGTREYQLPN